MAQVECKILPDESGFKEGEIKVIFTITNTSLARVRVLKWGTPLEGLVSDCLEVFAEEKKIPYAGKLIKRSRPEEEDFTVLKAGETLKASVDLTDGYDVPDNRKISVKFKEDKLKIVSEFVSINKMLLNLTENKINKAEVVSEGTTFSVPPLANKKKPMGQRLADERKKKIEEILHVETFKFLKFFTTKKALEPAFIDGTDADEQIVKRAHNVAYKMVNEAIENLNKQSHNQFIFWFCHRNTISRRRITLDVYKDLKKAMETETFIYNLSRQGCERNVYGYTYPGTNEIWLCSAFWAAPSTGEDSKAGTIVHELTHAVAYTDDHDYGRPECALLAINDPDKAVSNADNYEFYAEG